MATDYEGANRRKYPRIDGSACRIEYKVLPEENKLVYDFLQSSCANSVGAGGISFLTDNKHNFGTFLQLKIIIITDNKEISAIGRVVRSEQSSGNQFQTACFFVSIDKSDYTFLVDYINSVIKNL